MADIGTNSNPYFLNTSARIVTSRDNNVLPPISCMFEAVFRTLRSSMIDGVNGIFFFINSICQAGYLINNSLSNAFKLKS
jgi:hypothetical protein